MDWKAILGYFAQPLGALINKGLAAGSAALIGYGVAKGWPMAGIEPLIATAVLAISTAISGWASTQGIKIDVINKDETNGVKVVSVNSPSEAVNAPIK